MEIREIFCVNSQRVYSISLKKRGENRVICPECSHLRKKKNEACLSFDYDSGIGFCHHCESRFINYAPHEEKQYKRPEWNNFTNLSDKAVKWFSGKRSISQSTLSQMNISGKNEYLPQVKKETYCLAFPFYKNGELINIKYRDSKKNFKLESGAELVWYNYDALKKYKEIIITEGEIDALSFIEEGYENVISVPNGANIGSMPYFESSIQDLDKIDKFYIAVDVDSKGIQLKDELVRRLGAEKCFICNFKEYKDANEYLVGNGRKSLSGVLKTAKEVRPEGVYSAEDFLPSIENLFKIGLQKGKLLNIPKIDDLISWETKRLAIVTGVPGSGKSEVVDFICAKLNLLYKWRIGLWTPENFPLEYHYSKIFEKIAGRKFSESKIGSDVFWDTYEFIKQNYFWVAPEENHTIDNVLDKFRYLVKSKGIKVLVLDPFNKFEYKLEKGESKLDYISRILDKIIWFARTNDVLVFLIAHPRKLQKNTDGTFPIPTMYDISGSADFWNKTDYGISVYRDQNIETGKFENTGGIAIQKIKFKHLGDQGIFEFKYNYNNGRYEQITSTVDYWDNSNWLSNPELSPVNASDAFSVLDEQDNDLPF